MSNNKNCRDSVAMSSSLASDFSSNNLWFQIGSAPSPHVSVLIGQMKQGLVKSLPRSIWSPVTSQLFTQDKCNRGWWGFFCFGVLAFFFFFCGHHLHCILTQKRCFAQKLLYFIHNTNKLSCRHCLQFLWFPKRKTIVQSDYSSSLCNLSIKSLGAVYVLAWSVCCFMHMCYNCIKLTPSE